VLLALLGSVLTTPRLVTLAQRGLTMLGTCPDALSLTRLLLLLLVVLVTLLLLLPLLLGPTCPAALRSAPVILRARRFPL
jgi:hypothetical protein